MYLSVPLEQVREKALIEGKSLEEIQQREHKVYTFTNIIIPTGLRTYVGKNYTPTGDLPAGLDEQRVTKSMQRWYFEYYLPSEIYICEKGVDVGAYAKQHYGIDGTEDFWLKEGELIVNFEIETIANGERKLSYTNIENARNGYCNMWELEGYQYTKIDANGQVYNFENGDTLMYSLEDSVARDYFIGGTH